MNSFKPQQYFWKSNTKRKNFINQHLFAGLLPLAAGFFPQPVGFVHLPSLLPKIVPVSADFVLGEIFRNDSPSDFESLLVGSTESSVVFVSSIFNFNYILK